MKVSATFGGIGSVAISAVPIFEKTPSPPGYRLQHLLELRLHINGLVRLVPGMRMACIAISPSSRPGMNSLPMREATMPDQDHEQDSRNHDHAAIARAMPSSRNIKPRCARA